MRYYLTPTGKPGAVTGPVGLAVVPDGYREVTEAEYNAAAGAITLPLSEASSPDQEDTTSAVHDPGPRVKA